MSEPELADDAVTVLWAVAYWDGPLNGICLYNEQLHWFECCVDDIDRPRLFAIYDLDADEVREEVTRHVLFEQYVGTHGCYHVSFERHRRPEHGGLRPADESGCWDRFYKRDWPEHFKPGDRDPIGYWPATPPVPVNQEGASDAS